MSVVTVLTPNGRRQTVRCSPNQTCMHILDEVCRKHDFAAADYELIHHRRVLDLTLMFRFAGLPNNAQLEMQAATKKRGGDQAVVLMLQLESGERRQAQFAPDSTVAEIVQQLCPPVAGAEAEAAKAGAAEAVCVYMRTEIWGDRLRETTLRSLGLTGGRAAMRLVHKDPARLREQANVSAPLPQRPVAEEEQPRMAAVAVGEKQASSATDATQKAAQDRPVEAPRPSAAAAAMDVDMDAADDAHLLAAAARAEKSPSQSPVERKKVKIDAAVTGPSATASVTAPAPAPTSAAPPPPITILGPRSACIFSLDEAASSAATVGQQLDAASDSFYEVSVNDLKVLLRDLKCAASGQDEAPLLTQKLRDLDEAKRTMLKLGRYRRAVIRVQFSDRLVLQGLFAAVDRVSDVRQWVSGFLRDGGQPFELFTTPPKSILADETTLVEAHCVPTAVLHFGGCDGSEAAQSPLKAEFVAQQSPAAAAVAEAAKCRGLQNDEDEADGGEQEGGAVGGAAAAGHSSAASSSGAAPSRQQHNFKASTSAAVGDSKLPKWFKPTGK